MKKERFPRASFADPRKFNTRASKKAWEEITPDEKSATRVYESIANALKSLGLTFSHDSTVLEVGFGKGQLLKKLKNLGFTTIGVDARPRATPLSGNMVQARIERLPIAGDSVDYVISTNVFDQYVYNQDQAAMMTEIARVLKQGGIFVSIMDHVEVDEAIGLRKLPYDHPLGDIRLYQKV